MLSWPVVLCQYNKIAQVHNLQVLSESTAKSVSVTVDPLFTKTVLALKKK